MLTLLTNAEFNHHIMQFFFQENHSATSRKEWLPADRSTYGLEHCISAVDEHNFNEWAHCECGNNLRSHACGYIDRYNYMLSSDSHIPITELRHCSALSRRDIATSYNDIDKLLISNNLLCHAIVAVMTGSIWRKYRHHMVVSEKPKWVNI